MSELADRYRGAFEKAFDAIVVADDDGRYIDANQSACDLFGLGKEDLLGCSIEEFAPEDYDFEAAWREFQASDGDVATFPLIRADGDRRTVEYAATPNIVPGEHLSILRDITERREREKELEKMQRRFEAVLENTTTPMYMKTADGEYIFVNREYRELYDLHDKEIIGRTDHELHPREMADVLQKNDRSVIETGEPIEIEERVLVDGEDEIHLSTKVPVYATGEHSDPDDLVAVFGVSVDITERKKYEERLHDEQQFVKSIFRSLPDPLYATDTEGNLIRWNEKLETVTGYTSDELERMHVAELIHKDERDALINNFQPVIESQQPVTAETIVHSKDGEQIPYEVTGGPLEDADGTVRGLTGIARNITIRKRREQQLEDFASFVSHDLRNPLNVAEGRLKMAQKECKSEHLDSIGGALTRMGALIDDLLTLAREGDVLSQTEPVEIDALVESCWRLVDTGEATLVTDVSRTVQADRSRLQQLLENLIRNAVEHAGEDATVTVGELDDGFYLEDDGPGIPEDQHDIVFEGGYSTNPEGTGFGLAIVKQVAEAHDWDVHVSNGSGEGARFEITGVKFTDQR